VDRLLTNRPLTFVAIYYQFILPPWYIINGKSKGKGILRQAEVAQGVPGRLRPRIFSSFGTTRVVGRQPNAPAAFTPGEIPGTTFSEAESTSGHMALSEGTMEKIPSDTTGDRSRDRPTSSTAP
jgi:hypothetical protein